MKLASLETLKRVLVNGSFAAAAQEIGLTPSAVSLQMRQLEEYFGRPLFDRSGRVVQPTPFARELSESLSQVLGVFEGFRTQKILSVSGLVRLGAIHSVQASVLPMVLRTLQAEHPNLKLQLTLGVSAALQEALNAGRLDAAVVVRPKSGGTTRLEWRDLARIPFVLLAPTSALGKSATQMLREYPWIRYHTALTGGRIAAQYVRRLCPGTKSAYEVTSTDAIVAMVSEGLGVSVIPQPRRPLLQAYAVREIALGSSAPSRQVALICRKADAEDRRVQGVFEALTKAFEMESCRSSARPAF